MIRRPPRSTLFPYTDALPILVEVMTHLAIAHPQVMFRLVEQGRQVLSLAAAKDLIERLAQLYGMGKDRKSTRLNSSHANISYAVFCLKKKKNSSQYLVNPTIS